jgi:YD repeat-containing protein
MAYNANNLMTSFTATGVSVQTAYDAAGRRVRKIKGTEVTLWVYDAAGRLADGLSWARMVAKGQANLGSQGDAPIAAPSVYSDTDRGYADRRGV